MNKFVNAVSYEADFNGVKTKTENGADARFSTHRYFNLYTAYSFTQLTIRIELRVGKTVRGNSRKVGGAQAIELNSRVSNIRCTGINNPTRCFAPQF